MSEPAANAPASGAFIVDHTSLSMYKECPQKYQYAIVLGLRPKTAAAPLVFGSAIHDCLEHFERALALGCDRDEALAGTIRRALTAELPPDPVRTRLTLCRALVWYERHFRNDQLTTHILPNGRPALELSFRVELPFNFSHSEDPVIYCGHIDKIADYQGRLYAVERKHTVSALSEHYWDRYVFSSQIAGYVMAAKASFSTPIGGAIIDSTQIGVTFARFGRRIVNRTEQLQQEWLLDLHYWLSLLDQSFSSDRWPRNSESCSKYGGCQFRRVCFASPLVRDVVLRDEFRVERWNPLKPRGDEE